MGFLLLSGFSLVAGKIWRLNRYYLEAGSAPSTRARNPGGGEKRADLVQRYGDRAMEVLRETIGEGFFKAQHVKRFPDLDLLRSREDARKVLDELQKRAQ